MLKQIFYGNTLADWLISFCIILGAMLLNKGIVWLNKHFIHKLTAKTNNRLDDILFTTLEAPILFGIMLFAIWIASKRLDLGLSIENLITTSFRALIVVNITWSISRFVHALIEEYLLPQVEQNEHKHIDNHLMSIIRRSIIAVIWIVGLVVALNSAGIKVGALIAGLGIGGLAFALAAQDTIKNVFGGFTIFTDRPFRIGDRIKVDGFDGFVEDIGVRSTRLRTLEKRLVTIPNYKIVEAPVENVSQEPMFRVLMKLSLAYHTSPEKMLEAIAILKNIPKKIKHIDTKDVIAVFSEFSHTGLVLTFLYFVKKQGDIMETPSQVNMEILQSFNEAGLQFSFPIQTVHIETDITKASQ